MNNETTITNTNGAPDIPTEEELAELPIWARVALAARCARDVRPIVASSESIGADDLESVDNAIEAAEQAAGRAGAEVEEIQRGFLIFFMEATRAFMQTNGGCSGLSDATLAATSARLAAAGAAMATIVAARGENDNTTKFVAGALRSGVMASTEQTPRSEIVARIRDNMETLRQLAETSQADAATPFGPDVFEN